VRLAMLQVNISFPSGSGNSLLLPEHSKVGDLKLLAQKSLGRGFLKLVTANGHVLNNLADSLQSAGVQDGERLTVVAQQPNMIATARAFAMWSCGSNTVIIWGDPDSGGDCSTVGRWIGRLGPSARAFAAILADGSVVTTGAIQSAFVLQDQLRNVQQIQATYQAFALHLLQSWRMDLLFPICCFLGDPYNGGDCSAVRDHLRNVQRLEATESAFAAILADGSVVAWGEHNYGGYFNCSQVQDHLQYL